MKQLILIALAHAVGARAGTYLPAPEEIRGRSMASLWANTSNSSRRCKQLCIDESNIFCGNSLDGRNGVCCRSPFECDKYGQQDIFCSNYVSSVGMAYYACPRDPGLCGTAEVISVAREGETRLSLYRLVASQFENGEVCRYRLEFPFEAGIYDQITVTAKSLKHAKAFLVETEEL